MREPPATAAGERRGPLARFSNALREFAYGMTGFEFARHALETRAALENVFVLTVAGDMIGVPVMPPYYSLRLLPYVVPDIAVWKRRVLREREFTDEHEHHLHGV
jgi:hypothetical protein